MSSLLQILFPEDSGEQLSLSLFLFLVLIPVEYINARHVLDGKAAYRMRSEKTIALVKIRSHH